MESMASEGSLKEIAFCCPDLSTISRLYKPISSVSTDRQFCKKRINLTESMSN